MCSFKQLLILNYSQLFSNFILLCMVAKMLLLLVSVNVADYIFLDKDMPINLII